MSKAKLKNVLRKDLQLIQELRSEIESDLAALDIAEMGKCQGCQMPEYAIYHECQAREMKHHLTYTSSQSKPEGEDFYLCESCEIKRTEEECGNCGNSLDLNACEDCQELFCLDCCD
ncbi:17063_t:CDS:2, partial [Racocetra fulgida]